MTITEINDFLYENIDKGESALRELFTEPNFIDSNENWKFICYIHQYIKFSLDFIRELGQHTKINWNNFMNSNSYSQEEKNEIIKQFKLVKIPAFNGFFNWSEK